MNETLSISGWERSQWKENISTFDIEDLEEPGNERLKRLYNTVKVLGMAALDDAKMAEVILFLKTL